MSQAIIRGYEQLSRIFLLCIIFNCYGRNTRPPNVPLQADGARDLQVGGQLPSGPTYQLVRGSIFDTTTYAIVINTDHNMRECFQFPGMPVRREWRRKAGLGLTTVRANILYFNNVS